MDSPEEFLSLVLSQYKKSNDIAYTLSCFCTEKFSLEKPEEDLPVVKNLRGQWTSDNAGGPVGQNGFFQNPMYLIKIPVETTIRIQCSTVKTYSVNAMLISINKHRKEDYSSYRQVVKMRGRPILDSGVYRFGFTTTNQEQVPAGEYVLVLSTFRCGQVGTFSASVNSSIKLEISVVPS
jgi:calpain-7